MRRGGNVELFAVVGQHVDHQPVRREAAVFLPCATLAAARVTYFLSKRTAACLTAGRVRNSGAAALAVSPGAGTLAGMHQSGIMLGLRHAS